jgi:hypothetical protein
MTHLKRRSARASPPAFMIAALGWLFGLALYDDAANWWRLLMEVWMGFSFSFRD